MSIIHDIDFTRIDSGSDGGFVTPEDIAKLGPAIRGAGDFVKRMKRALDGSPGWDDSRTDGQLSDFAVRGIADGFGPILGIDAKPVEARTDAPTDFTTSGLTLELGPGAEIVHGQDEEFLFIPGRAPSPLLPVSNPMQPGFRKFRYPVRTHTGQAKWTHPSDTRNLENVGVNRDRKEQGAEYYGIGYEWTIPQTWEWSALGVSGQTELASAANYEMDAFSEFVAGWGDADRKIPGFFTLGDAIIALMGTPISELADAQAILNLLGYMEHLYRKANNNARPTRAVVPLADEYAMNTTRFGADGEGDSVMTVARGLYPWINNITWTDRMDEANEAGDGPRWQLYRDMPQDLFLGSGQNLVFGPFQDRMVMQFVILRRLTGVVGKRPESIMYADFDAYTP